jgi:hypothetical protein
MLRDLQTVTVQVNALRPMPRARRSEGCRGPARSEGCRGPAVRRDAAGPPFGGMPRARRSEGCRGPAVRRDAAGPPFDGIMDSGYGHDAVVAQYQ